MEKKQDFFEKIKDLIGKMMKKDFNEDLFREKLRETVSIYIKEDLL